MKYLHISQFEKQKKMEDGGLEDKINALGNCALNEKLLSNFVMKKKGKKIPYCYFFSLDQVSWSEI